MQHHAHLQETGTSIAEWLPVFLCFVVALAYLFSLIVLNKRGNNWSMWRTLSFMCGICLVSTAMLPALAQWAHSDLRGHMVQHLLLGMFAPIFLVLGAPLTLVLKVVPVKIARSFTTVLKSKVFYVVSHPVTAFLLNIGGMYVLYLTPLYTVSLAKPYLHYVMHLHFLAAGYLFTWSMIGLDPAPKRPKISVRVCVLFLSIAAHAFLSKVMYAYLYPLHSPHSTEQIREAAQIMYYWGDLSELLLTIVLFLQWYQKRGRAQPNLSPLIS